MRGVAAAVASAVSVLIVVGGSLLVINRSSVDTVDPADVDRPATSLPTTSALQSTDAPAPQESVRLADEIISVSASSEFPGFHAANLIDGSTDTTWQDLSLRGAGAELTFEFRPPVYLDAIVISNQQNYADLFRNYRIKDFEIEYPKDSGSAIVAGRAPGTAEPHSVNIGALIEGPVRIRVLSVYPAETVDGRPAFNELAIAEIEFYGHVELGGDPRELVGRDNRAVDEGDLDLAYTISEALKLPEKPAATQAMRDIERDAGLTDFRLIASGTEMMTERHRRDESIYVLPGECVLKVWWRQIDLSWDLPILDEGEAPRPGWVPGAVATVIDNGSHIQVIFAQGEIMGPVVLVKPIGKKNEPYEMNARVEDLAKKALASLWSDK